MTSVTRTNQGSTSVFHEKISSDTSRWWMVVVSFIGIAFGQTAMVFLTLGVFMKPLHQEYGWTRGQVAAALSVAAVTLLLTTPFVGRLMDRHGPRKILIPSMAGVGVLLCAMYFQSSSLTHFYLLFACIGIVGAGANNVGYVRVLTAWFKSNRGLAIGIASSGVAAGHVIGSAIAQGLITEYNWRVAYVGLGLAVLFVGMPIVGLFIKNGPPEKILPPSERNKRSAAASGTEFGVEKSAALRMPTFWLLMLISLTMSTALHGLQVHLTPLLLDAGISPAQAAGSFIVCLSTGAIMGRIGTGFLFDRFFAPRVAVCTFSLSVMGILIIMSGAGISALYVGIFFLGLALGSEADVLGYLTSRYFGLKAIGELYGYVFGAFMAGTATGPVLYGFIYGKTGNYDATMIMSVGLMVIVCGALMFLPRFKDGSTSGH